MEFGELLHDKRLWYGAGVAAAVGAYALVARKRNTGSSLASGTATYGAGAGGLGSFDSTGSDVANQLGQFGGSLQNQLDQYQQQLTSTLAGAAQVPTGSAGAAAGAKTTKGPQWINIFGGEHVDDFVHTLNNLGNPITYGQLVTLNPQLPNWINWLQGKGPNADHSKNTFKFNTALKLW